MGAASHDEMELFQERKYGELGALTRLKHIPLHDFYCLYCTTEAATLKTLIRSEALEVHELVSGCV